MNKNLEDILNLSEDNYILPFFWPLEGNPERIPEMIEKIYSSGIRAFCVEARPYEDFAGPTWWHDLKIILSEAERRNMKVWILDDKHFPTGFANGLIQKKYPHLQRRFLREHHVDVMGPARSLSVLVPEPIEGEKILGIYAYKRTGNGEEICGEPIFIDKYEDSDFVTFDLPEGCYRIFVLYDSWLGSQSDHRWYINMLSKESVHVLIEAVYEEHYKNVGEYFGETIAGFFSDEPTFSCAHIGPWDCDEVFYYRTVGHPGTALPWDTEVADRMKKEGIHDTVASLPALWYSMQGREGDIRLAYMNTITHMWNENFSSQLSDWCHKHGVEYIGHIIEDMNAHSRIGGSAGHYFRALSGQDMAGIDVVLHQILPGMGDYMNAALIAGGKADPQFFHYTLAHLASSLARFEPHMKGRAMCEVFGAYGWAEGTPTMKWIMDFMLIRGINHFVPHAFSAKFINEDCPPHFYSGGNNPQFESFSELMHYSNRVAHLLNGSFRKTSGAVFYYAESEWMSNGNFMYGDVVCQLLYDAQIDYDIVSLDYLKQAVCKNGELLINGHKHKFLVIPEAAVFPPELRLIAEKLISAGVPVYTLESVKYHYKNPIGYAVTTEELVPDIRKKNLAHNYKIKEHQLRVAQYSGDFHEYFYFFNESIKPVENVAVTLPVTGGYLWMDLLNQEYFKSYTESGTVQINLMPGQSVILLFDDTDKTRFNKKPQWTNKQDLSLKWDIMIREAGKEHEFHSYKQNSELFNITGHDSLPDFSGEIKYTSRFELDDSGKFSLDLGEVGLTAKLTINGLDLGQRISAPYSWDISNAAKPGTNIITVTVANTLVHRCKDRFSVYMPIPASGLIGPLSLKKEVDLLQ